MKTMVYLFISSLGMALVFTPIIRWIANRLNCVDKPCERKVHTRAIPRLGGIGIYAGVCVPVVFLLFFQHQTAKNIFTSTHFVSIFIGGTLVFLMGAWDDLKPLNPYLKLIVQTFAAITAYYGGIQIQQLQIPWGYVISLNFASLPVTVFWFLLVINAINLIDGLDGLAAGVSLFVSLTLIAVCLMSGQLTIAFGLSALAGACIGFLRYNFNPASIFMGDSGSYFLGYMLAAYSILGSLKSQATVAILIPIIALGVPLMDTLIAPARRFILGKRLFKPDKNHIHHHLLKIGLSHRKAVLILYGATVAMGILALIAVHAVDHQAGLFFLVIGLLSYFAFRKLGYLEYFAIDKVIGYFRDVTDEIGLQKDRRTFLCIQKEILESKTAEEMWHCIIDALAKLNMDWAEIQLIGEAGKHAGPRHFTWCRPDIQGYPDERSCNIMSLNLPLVNHKMHGTLFIKKDMTRSQLCPYTLRRIEQLRRSIVNRLVMPESLKSKDRMSEKECGSDLYFSGEIAAVHPVQHRNPPVFHRGTLIDKRKTADNV